MVKECDRWCQLWHKKCVECDEVIHQDEHGILFFTNNLDGLLNHIDDQKYMCEACYLA